MKTGKNYILGLLITLTLALILCSMAIAITVQAAEQAVTIEQSDTVAQVQAKIQSAITATAGSGVVTVTGSKSGANATLTLDIPAGVTVVWGAEYSGGINDFRAMINTTGEGLFEVAAGGLVKNTGNYGKLRQSCDQIKVLGGMLLTTPLL